jgi:hypothetical protein
MGASRTTRETFADIASGIKVLWWRFFDWLAVVPWKTLVIVSVLLMILLGAFLGAPQVAFVFIVASFIIKVVAGGKHSAEVASSQAEQRAEMEQLMSRIYAMDDPTAVAAALDAEKGRLRYFIDTSWNVKARQE